LVVKIDGWGGAQKKEKRVNKVVDGGKGRRGGREKGVGGNRANIRLQRRKRGRKNALTQRGRGKKKCKIPAGATGETSELGGNVTKFMELGSPEKQH